MEDMSSGLLCEGLWWEANGKEPAEELMSTALRDRPEQNTHLRASSIVGVQASGCYEESPL